MGFTFAHQGLVLVLAASMLGVSLANKDWGSHTNGPKKIVVGGSEKWTFGVNYTDWSHKNAPFYSNDTLGT